MVGQAVEEGGGACWPSINLCSRLRTCVLDRTPSAKANSAAVSTSCSSWCSTRARISTMSLSPPGWCRRFRCKCRNASGNSRNGAPLRKAPGGAAMVPSVRSAGGMLRRVALDHRQIMPPVIKCAAGTVCPLDDAGCSQMTCPSATTTNLLG